MMREKPYPLTPYQMPNKVHYGSIRQYAHSRGKDFLKIYKQIKDGEFKDEGATVIREQKDVIRIRWN